MENFEMCCGLVSVWGSTLKVPGSRHPIKPHNVKVSEGRLLIKWMDTADAHKVVSLVKGASLSCEWVRNAPCVTLEMPLSGLVAS